MLIKNQKNKKKLNGLDKYIIFSFGCLILYTIGAYFVLIKTGLSLDLLTSLFFGIFGGEVLICALIKKLKLKQKDPKNQNKEEDVING